MPLLLGIALLPLNSMGPQLSEEAICLVLIGLNGFAYFWYIINVIKQITGYLDIYCLSIKNKDKKD
jgi:hypothetical protein